ncbi:MAG: hypothetical protein R3B13_39030 [Polyangiaceae bacterium]
MARRADKKWAAYLTWAFERLGTHRDLFALPLEALTPAAFSKTLD